MYPSLDAHSDLERTYRDVQPSSLGITAIKTGFFTFYQFWGAQYFRMWEVVYEDDKLTLFGTLTYDTNTDQASLDDIVSMMASQAKDSIISKLNWDYAKECFKVVGYATLALSCVFLSTACISLIRDRLRELRLAVDNA